VVTSATASTDSHGNPRCRVFFSYTQNGVSQNGVKRVSSDEYNRLRTLLDQPEAEGAAHPPTIRVRSLTVGPMVDAFPTAMGNDQSVCGVILFPGLVMGFFGVVFGLVFIQTGFVEPAKERRLYLNGLAAPGVIKDVQVIKGKGTSYVLTYTFHPRDGQERQGMMRISPDKCPATMGMGTQVTVLYEEAGKLTKVYEYGLFKCV
jgi:hypothetical protein